MRIITRPYAFHDDAAYAHFVFLTEHPENIPPAEARSGWVGRAQQRIAAAGYIIKPSQNWGRAKGGRSVSDRKQSAAQQNGKLGGRPRKTQVNVDLNTHSVGLLTAPQEQSA
jgi:hypothetical protein